MSMPLEDSTNRRVKFMCSFGGKILPRPGDGRLRYVGGETRIINVNRDISYTELMFKVTEIYGHALTLKYQLPDEELDALVSVSSDEDLENMMEEYDKLEGSDGFSRLRIFLFPAISQDMASLIHVPVALPVSSVPLSVSSIHTNADVPSLPTSAPVSPPLIPRLYRATPDSIIPPTTTDQQQTFQQQQQYFWTSLSAPAINEAGYHPVEDHMQEDAFSMPFVSQSIAQTIPPPIGSDPSSPRISFQESGRYPGGYQQSQVHRGYNGADYVEQLHSGVLYHPNDPPSRPFHPSPQFGDHLVHPEERLLRPLQQPAHVSSERLQHEQCLYELNTLSQSQISDPVTRSPIPHYVGSNPFQEGLPLYEEYQDAVHKQQYQVDGNQALYTEQQRHFHPQQSSSRLEYQNQVLHPVEKPIHSQYQNQLEKGTDWGLQQQQGHDMDGAQVRVSSGIFGSSEQLQSVVMGVQSCGMFESSGQLQSGVMGGQAKPSVNNIIDMEQEPMKGIQVSSNGLQRKGGLSDDDVMLTLYGLQNLLLDDRPPLKGQKPLPTREMQSMLPPTSKMISNVVQTPSIQEFTAATTLTEEMPPSCLYPTVTSIPDCIPSACATAAINVEVNQNHGPVNLLQEELKKESYFCNTASDAEAEAISWGLQTIKDADLEEMRELGSGTFGTVYHGKWRGTDVAIKRIRASCFAGQPSEQERLTADFWKEASILSQLHHPNVVAFYGVVRDGPGGTLATVTEYMVNGSLKQVLQKRDRTIDRRKRLLIATDAAFGMEYLHSKNIVHFDLKCENLLVNMRDPHRPICKVGDLGLSKVKHQTMVSGGVRGTLPWMAPELLNGTSTMVTEKVDVFSFGIVMWELLTGEEPYANLHYGAIIGGIVNNTLRPEVPTWCDPTWKLLMERCWASEPVERPGFSEIASDLRTMAVATHPKAQGQFHIPPPETSSK
ncbi:unnamed protein product [Sphagnum jensenii]|uniref:Protein kinase domain-containing protein n=1 Tax=Sphagnum jensenii TaxID=128206 RepID=A0ABP1A8E1_9BRYO